MTVSVIDRVTADRAIARQSRDNEAYQILTQILGAYQTGATLKKPKVGDGAIIEIIRLLTVANNESLELMRASTQADYADKILFLEKQNTMLSQYLPTLLTEEELRTILNSQEFSNIGAYQKFLRENYADRFKPGTAAQVFNAA